MAESVRSRRNPTEETLGGTSSDWKQPAKIRDREAVARKLLRERECRVPDCGEPATDPHHIVRRSHGGDDVEDNIVGLCRFHHDALHFAHSETYLETRYAIGRALASTEVLYVLRKLGRTVGADFLRRQYGYEG